MYLIDSHCHLNLDGSVDRLSEVFVNMRAQQVGQALAISVSRESFTGVLTIAENNDHAFYIISVHPNRRDTAEFSVAEMMVQAWHPKVVGIGEIDLNYYRCRDDLTWQHRRFADHTQAANEAGLPVVVHTRGATADILRLLKECNTRVGVTHCFSEDVASAKAALDLGLYISFPGIATFKNTPLIQEATKYAPTDRMLVETDSLFLAPVPKRGKPNEPSHVRYTAKFLAKLRGEILEQVAETTTENFYRLFSKVPRIA